MKKIPDLVGVLHPKSGPDICPKCGGNLNPIVALDMSDTIEIAKEQVLHQQVTHGCGYTCIMSFDFREKTVTWITIDQDDLETGGWNYGQLRRN